MVIICWKYTWWFSSYEFYVFSSHLGGFLETWLLDLISQPGEDFSTNNVKFRLSSQLCPVCLSQHLPPAGKVCKCGCIFLYFSYLIHLLVRNPISYFFFFFNDKNHSQRWGTKTWELIIPVFLLWLYARF